MLSKRLPQPKSKSINRVTHHLDDGDPLKIYGDEVAKAALISPEEQLELLRRYRETGDKEARKKVIESVLKLVFSIAIRYNNNHKHTNFLDLVQEGNIGIMTAIEKFDFEHEAYFSTYAAYWIAAKITRYLTRNDLIRMPANYKPKLLRISKASAFLEGKLGRTPTAVEIASQTEMDIKIVKRVLKREREEGVVYVASMQEKALDSENMTYEDMLAGDLEDAGVQYDNADMMRVFKRSIEKVKKGLNERDKYILEKRLYSSNGMSLQHIGDKFGLSRERVRQIESNLKDKIREYLIRECPDYFKVRKHVVLKTKKKGKKMPKFVETTHIIEGSKPEESHDDEYKWTIARGVHVELRCNVQLRPEYFDKVIEFMKIISEEERAKTKFPVEIVANIIKPTNKITKKNLKVMPKKKHKKTPAGKLFDIIKSTLLESPDEWIGSGNLAKKAVKLGFWKNPPSAYQASMGTALKRLRGRVDWIETKKVGVKTLYRYKIKIKD